MNAKEVSVPMMIEDFEVGERVWYQDSKKLSKVLGTVVSTNKELGQMTFRSDDGYYAIIAKDWGAGTSGYPPVFEFRKALDVKSLSVGSRISICPAGTRGDITRIYAVVSSVALPRALGVTFERTEGDHMINDGKPPEEHIVKDLGNGQTIEYILAEWELEP